MRCIQNFCLGLILTACNCTTETTHDATDCECTRENFNLCNMNRVLQRISTINKTCRVVHLRLTRGYSTIIPIKFFSLHTTTFNVTLVIAHYDFQCDSLHLPRQVQITHHTVRNSSSYSNDNACDNSSSDSWQCTVTLMAVYGDLMLLSYQTCDFCCYVECTTPVIWLFNCQSTW